MPADGRAAAPSPDLTGLGTATVVAEAHELTVRHVRRGGGPGDRHVVAVDGVSIAVHPSEIVGLVGESGSGKSSVAMAMTGLGPRSPGSIRLHGEDLDAVPSGRLRALRGEVQVVFQDPHGSLDPRQSVRAGLAELRSLQPERTRWIDDVALLQRVRLDADLLDRYPHQLSGGQAQRLCIARALLLRPTVLIADEPTSGLDVSVQAEVMRLLLEIRDATGVAILFISHDLSVVRRLCDTVHVMLRGRVVEHGPADDVLLRPQHEYTQRLLDAVPGRKRRGGRRDAGSAAVERPEGTPTSSAAARRQRLAGTTRFVGRQAGLAVITLLLALTAAFLLGRISGDPTVNILGPTATAEQIAALRAQLGLDRPLITQYLEFMSSLFTGSFGDSLQYNQSNLSLIGGRIGATFQLVLAGIVVAIVVGVPLGAFAALREGSRADRVASTFALLGQSIPVFWLGLMLVLIFAVWLGVLPAGQAGGIEHLVLPALTLSLLPMAHIARMTRATMAEVLREPHIVAARARGLPSHVVLRHALRNASPPVLTITALQAGALLSGAVAVEYVYSWPGLGLMSINAVLFKDFPLIQTIVVVGAVIFVLINLLVDVLYGVIDPRIGDQRS